MILYFDDTASSWYVAKCIAVALGNQLLSMNSRIKAGDTLPIEINERLVILTPAYAWRIPRLVKNWLRQAELPGAKQAWLL